MVSLIGQFSFQTAGLQPGTDLFRCLTGCLRSYSFGAKESGKAGSFPRVARKRDNLTTVDKLFRKARKKAGLPEKLVLYCGRHDFGTELLARTRNLALIMKAMGQKSLKAAMAYQHPELEQVRLVLNDRNGAREKRPVVN